MYFFYGALWAKLQPEVLNPFVLICGCLLYRRQFMLTGAE